MSKVLVEELPLEFEGRGGQKGYTFRQVNKTKKAYLYEVKSKETGHVYYEVFKRRVRKAENRVRYPKSECFGFWAWCISSLERAEQKFAAISR